MNELTISVSSVLYICGAIITISSVVVLVNKFFKTSVKKVTCEVIDQKMKEVKDENKKSIDTVNESIQSLSKTLKEFVDSNTKSISDIKNALMLDIRARIIQEYNNCRECSKATDNYTLSVLEDLFKVYDSWGGNSHIDSLMEQIREYSRKGAEGK